MTKEECLDRFGELPEDLSLLEFIPSETLPLTKEEVEIGISYLKELNDA